MDATAQSAIWSAVRSILIAGGAWLAGKNLLDSETASALVGALMVAIPATAGVVAKIMSERKARQAIAEAVQTGVVAVKIGAVDPSIPITPLFAAALVEKLAPTLPAVKPLPNPLVGP